LAKNPFIAHKNFTPLIGNIRQIVTAFAQAKIFFAIFQIYVDKKQNLR